jgi:hypothetical protein
MGETAAIVCVDPITQTKVSGVLTGTPSTITYPEPVGFEVIVIMTPKFAVSVIGAFIVIVAELLVPESLPAPVPVHESSL